ncbi:hypothetical protein [Dactylosporangium sp. NPDC051484]|uniref:hypothetical protein n=1 Tax=Dactylosporangium sp. NPDC051484 TaxID=3154942 RepID=UPI00344B87A1
MLRASVNFDGAGLAHAITLLRRAVTLARRNSDPALPAFEDRLACALIATGQGDAAAEAVQILEHISSRTASGSVHRLGLLVSLAAARAQA